MESAIVYQFPPKGNVHRPRIFVRFIGIFLALFVTVFIIMVLISNNYLDKNSKAFISGEIFENESLIDNNGNKREIISKHFENTISSSQNVNKDCARSLFDEKFVKTLSPDRLMIVEEMKNKIVSSLTTPFCEMSSEFNLVRWFRLKNWDFEDTEKALLSTIRWRKEYRVDELFTGDYGYFEDAFLLYMDGLDYEGRVVVTADLSSVDIRKILIAGKGKQLIRYYTRIAEFAMKYTREEQVKGRNITQAIFIINFQGFNMEQHGCDQCMAVSQKMFYNMEAYYPYGFYKGFLINTPAEFEWIFNAMKDLYSSEMMEAVEIYGTNKREWQKAILKLIPADQIRPHFGGTKGMEHD